MRAFAGLVPLALWLVPAVAAACPVCVGGVEEDSRQAFIWTTVFLSVLPPGMVGGLIWWIWRRSRELEAQTDSSRSELEIAATPPLRARG